MHKPLNQELGRFGSMGLLEKKSAVAYELLGVTAMEPLSEHALQFVEVLVLSLCFIRPQLLPFNSLVLG